MNLKMKTNKANNKQNKLNQKYLKRILMNVIIQIYYYQIDNFTIFILKMEIAKWD